MKRTTYVLRTTTKTMLLFVAIAMLTIASACNKSDNNDEENSELYTPPTNLSNAEIINLINTANTTIIAESIYTMTVLRTEIEDDKTVSSKRKEQCIRNSVAKKELFAGWDLLYSAEPIWFYYTENSMQYQYYEDNNRKECLKVTDAYFNVMLGDLPQPTEYTWKVVGQTLVGTYDETVAKGITYTITLTKDKKYNAIEYASSYLGSNEKKTEQYTFDYSNVTPAMPAGFNKADFTTIQQFSLKVIWGEGKGENTFYSEAIIGGTGLVEKYTLLDYAPIVAGKKPEFYYDQVFNNMIPTASIPLTDNNKVIYAKWVTAN